MRAWGAAAALVVAVVAGSGRLSAQQHARLGIGVPVTGDTRFLLPIVFGGLRVEPQLSYYRAETRDPFSGETTTFSSLAFGVSLHRLFALRESVRAYAGPSFGTERTRGAAAGSATSTKGWFAGAVMGGEYEVSRRFWVGAEAGLTYTDFAAPSGTFGPMTRLSTEARAVVRVLLK